MSIKNDETGSSLYYIISTSTQFIPSKDYYAYLDSILYTCYDKDIDIQGIIAEAEENEDERFIKYALKFLKENGLEDEEDDIEEEIW